MRLEIEIEMISGTAEKLKDKGVDAGDYEERELNFFCIFSDS